MKAVNPLTMQGNRQDALRALRLILTKEVNHCCEQCHASLTNGRFEIHHRNGRLLDWRRENLVVLCAPCHHKITPQNNKQGELPHPTPFLTRGYNKLYSDITRPSLKEIKEQYALAFPRAF